MEWIELILTVFVGLAVKISCRFKVPDLTLRLPKALCSNEILHPLSILLPIRILPD